MILVDLSQISHAALAAERAQSPNMPVEKGLLKHFIFNSLRMNTKKFRNDYGKVIICADSSSWRRTYFKYYKANRDAIRSEDEEFWKTVFEAIQEVIVILDESSPYPVIKVDGAEADDCIAYLARKFAPGSSTEEDDFGGFGQEEKKTERVLILSGDKDFQQLQVLQGVDQYSPTLKKFLKCKDPVLFKMEHIAKGDSGDGVPNILSPDNSLVDKIRQKPITKKFLEKFCAGFSDPISIDAPIAQETFLRNFSRNKSLIDLLEEIPDDVEASIEEAYIRETENPRGNLETLRQAFIANRMKNMLDVLPDFRNK